MVVTKRDGRKVPFDKNKIESAMISAFKAVYDDAFSTDMEVFIFSVAEKIEDEDIDMTVEQIQDKVVKALLRSDYDEAAEEYIEYRHLHQLARDKYVELMKAVSTKLDASDVKNQNANVDEHSFGGRMGEANSLLMKKYALDYLISPMAKANHVNNEIYIHDLDHYAVGDHNCLSIPFDQLLSTGFSVRQTDIRPAQSLSTALQLVAVIFQVQSLQQFG